MTGIYRAESLRRRRRACSRSTASPSGSSRRAFRPADTYTVIPGFFDIVRAQNRGVAFGLFNESTFEWRTTLLVLVSVAAVVVVSAVIWKARRLDPLSLWGFALILGGAAGNLFDRILSGRVTDFLDFYIRDYHWPAFNVADSALVVGCGLLLLDMLRPQRQAANVP